MRRLFFGAYTRKTGVAVIEILVQTGVRKPFDGQERNGIAAQLRAHFPVRLAAGGGQILVCVAGRGYYQEWGKEAIEMKPGDCINIPPEVKHWHGAAPDAWFSHLAVEVPGKDGSNEWLEAVTDEQYSKLK